jgi:hypothetical protein
MEEMIGCCGFRCDLCPAYRQNLSGEEDQRRVSEGWFKYYGFRIPPENICCDGCLPENCPKPRQIDPHCFVRRCAGERGFPNCAHCDEYMCDELVKKMVNFDEIAARYGAPIPPEDYARFLKPYEAKKVLEEIRKTIGKST